MSNELAALLEATQAEAAKSAAETGDKAAELAELVCEAADTHLGPFLSLPLEWLFAALRAVGQATLSHYSSNLHLAELAKDDAIRSSTKNTTRSAANSPALTEPTPEPEAEGPDDA
jgi:hypothetical protein